MIWLAAGTALAQGFDAHGFHFATSGGDLLAPVQFVRPGPIRPLDWSVGALAEYASRPLLFRANGEDEVVLEDLYVANVSAGFAPASFLRVDVSAPFVLGARGTAGAGGVGVGDVRAHLLIAPLRANGEGFGLGLSAALDAPTGDPERYLGTTGIAGQVGLVATAQFGDAAFSALAGARFAPSTDPAQRPAPTIGGDTFEGAAQLGFEVGGSGGVGVEAVTSVPVDPVVREAIGVPFSLLAYGRYSLEGGNHVSIGIGTGLGGGAGASPVRVVVGAAFGGSREQRGPPAPKDRDFDGVVDRLDRCGQEAETPNGYLDQDGCSDTLPSILFIAQRDGVEVPDAEVTATAADGAPATGKGRVEVQGVPGAAFSAHVDAPSCYGATARAEVPQSGSLTVPLAIEVERAEVVLTVVDTAGRPVRQPDVRYFFEDPACEPESVALEAGTGVHRVGATDFTLFVTGPGYGVFTTPVSLTGGERRVITAKIAPTQVALRGGVVRFNLPLRFADGSAVVPASGLLDQLVTVLLTNESLRFEVQGFGGSSKLASERAQAMVDWLVQAGVPAGLLVPVGKGSRPSDVRDDVRIVVK